MTSIVEKQLLSEEKKNKFGVENGKRRAGDKPKNVPVSAFFCKVVDITEQPIVLALGGPLDINPNIRTTNGNFAIVYNPEGSPKRVKNKPYTIAQDLIAARISVSGPAHFKCLCQRIPELAFLKKWSNYDDGLFAMAKKHPGIAFSFTLRWCDYGNMIEKKAEELRLDIDHKPFVCYITTKEKLAEIRSKFLMWPKRTKEDIQTVLDEVDKEENINGK